MVLHSQGKNGRRSTDAHGQHRASQPRIRVLPLIKSSGLLDWWLKELLRREGDLASLRDLDERWLRHLLPTPRDSDPSPPTPSRGTTRCRGRELGDLAAINPDNGELALRAVEEVSRPADAIGRVRWTFLGVVQLRLGQLDQAEMAVLTAMQQVIDKEEHCLDFLVLAHVYAHRGRRDKALEWYEQYRNVEKTPVWALYCKLLESGVMAMLGLEVPPDGVNAEPPTGSMSLAKSPDSAGGRSSSRKRSPR